MRGDVGYMYPTPTEKQKQRRTLRNVIISHYLSFRANELKQI